MITCNAQKTQVEAQRHVQLASTVSAANKQHRTKTHVPTHTAMPTSAAEPKEQNTERQDSTDSNRLSPDPQQWQVPQAAASTTEATCTAGTTTSATVTEAASPAPTGTPGPSTVADAGQAWDTMFRLMSNPSSPMAFTEVAQAAMTITSTTWSFEAAVAMEAVIQQIVSRSPLTFANPHLGMVLRMVHSWWF